jgi:GTP cyclohydrolase II
MLLELGVRRVRLLTNNPRKVSAVEAATIVVEERVPLVAGAGLENRRYLQTKAEKLGHLFA